jgi:hypothetical protein
MSRAEWRWWWRQRWWHGGVGAGASWVSMDQVRGVWTSQARRPEEHTKASELAMMVMDWLSQNRNLKEQRSVGSSGYVQGNWRQWWWGRRWLQGICGCRASEVAGQWLLQGDGCWRVAMVASDHCRVEWKQEHPWAVYWPVERCGQSGRRIGKGWVELKGRGGGRGGGAACSVERSPIITESYVGLLKIFIYRGFNKDINMQNSIHRRYFWYSHVAVRLMNKYEQSETQRICKIYTLA